MQQGVDHRHHSLAVVGFSEGIEAPNWSYDMLLNRSEVGSYLRYLCIEVQLQYYSNRGVFDREKA